MADLIARYEPKAKSGSEKPEDAAELWTKTLPAGQQIKLGRHPDHSDWCAEVDRQISRLHVELLWANGKLRVTPHAKATNPVWFRGEKKTGEFTVTTGEYFVIGDTKFMLVASAEPESGHDELTLDLTCSTDELNQLDYVDPVARIEALTELPRVIRHALSEDELEKRVLKALIRGIPRAEQAAIVILEATAPEVRIKIRRTHGQEADKFKVSRRLINESVNLRRQPTVHIWDPAMKTDSYTPDPNIDWDLCAALPVDPTPGWAIYVKGRLHRTRLDEEPDQNILKSDMKFAELVAETYGAIRKTLHLQRRDAHMARFLSRPVRAAIAGQDIEKALEPKQTNVTVLFCDLRGSCAIAEEGSDDLKPLWEHINNALSIMARAIIDQDGVIGDFQGDAAMGFWGWPLASSEREQVERAARAALRIWEDFQRESERNPENALQCGIGIAHGPAIAGKLGTSDQFKVDVFGPTVNLAARLESMTKKLKVPILIEGVTADLLQQTTLLGVRRAYAREVGRVRPAGMTRHVAIFDLMPMDSSDRLEAGRLSDEQLGDYKAARLAFEHGRWSEAREYLSRLPDSDGPKLFLLDVMDRLQAPPSDWQGVIELDSK